MPHIADLILSLVAVDHIPEHLTSYIRGKTPFSTWPTVVTMTATYLLVVFGTHEAMKDRTPFKLTSLFRVHNLGLSIGSFILMALIGEEVFSNWLKPEIGTYGALCSPKVYTKRLEFYLMLNYCFKYYEFVDTIFLVLKKKQLSFLHVYHHAATTVLVFILLNHRVTMLWVAVFLNLGIHVLMYYYYFAAAGGAKIWWKKYLTTMQICQFVIILVMMTFVGYQHVAYNWFSMYLPHMGGCSASLTAGFIALGIVSSYLVLFLDFFREAYLRKAGPDTNFSGMVVKLSLQRRSKPSETSTSSSSPGSLLSCEERTIR